MAGRSTACTGDICINEVIPNPNGYDDANYPGGEWLELYNSGTVDVDLTGWKVTNTASQSLDFDSNLETTSKPSSGNNSEFKTINDDDDDDDDEFNMP